MDVEQLARRMAERPAGLRGRGRPSAVLALLAGNRLVLEVRAKTLRHQPGEICLPGGGMEPGEAPAAAALRETEEELGIPAAALRLLGPLDVLMHSNGRVVYPILAWCPPETLALLRPSLGEVEEVFTVPVEWFRANLPTPYQYRQEHTHLEGLPPQMAQWLASYPTLRQGGYWDYQGHLIWGLTAKVIEQVMEVVSDE